MLQFVACGCHKYVADQLKKGVEDLPKVAFWYVTLLPPIHGMDKVFGVGLNYKDHCKHHKLETPKVPMIFSKFSSTVIGPCDPIRIRSNRTKQVDYEVELCIVMGRITNNAQPAIAYEYVFGCTIGQDITARDWQKEMNGGQFLLGKSMDTFCPIGPCITTLDEIGDPEYLNIICKVNGQMRQESNTNQHIHHICDIIARISSIITLYPGDLILTGTPAGVGVYDNQFLKPGDRIYSEIDKIGCMVHKVIEWC